MRCLARLLCAGVVVLGGAITIATCGRDPHQEVVVRVEGAMFITTAMLADAMKGMALEHVLPDPPAYTACVTHRETLSVGLSTATLNEECRREYRMLKQRALALLITTAWLVGEAKQRRWKTTQVGRGAAERILLAMIAGRTTKIDGDAIARYYRSHEREFRIPERRYFEIQHLQTDAQAKRFKREVEAGRSMASTVIHEMIKRPSGVKYDREEEVARDAIFAARPNTLTGPIRVRLHYSLFIINRIVPARLRRFAKVKSAIERRLNEARKRKVIASFVKAWRSKWTAKTDCAAGYVVQKCRQYAGPRLPEDLQGFG